MVGRELPIRKIEKIIEKKEDAKKFGMFRMESIPLMAVLLSYKVPL